uniref:Uncharacterized protein n=1 Tax=Panagrolaimus sp. ES5 TaxID=591445 RepID=A0AC34FAM6_9BILA
MNISKVSDIKSLRPRDRNNPKVITAKVILSDIKSLRPRDRNNSSGRMNEFVDVKVDNYISFSHTKRSPVPYHNQPYKKGKLDLNIELIFGEHSMLHENIEHLENNLAHLEFDKLKFGMVVTVVGQSLYDVQKRESFHILSVADINEMIIEVKYLFDLKVKSEQKVIMTGKIEEDDGNLVLIAEKGRIWT